jgi:D-aminoacyl-tRNA deacylase
MLSSQDGVGRRDTINSGSFFIFAETYYMRAVIQRVSEASVTIDNEQKSTIGKGLLVLVGIEEFDTKEDIEWLSGKIARLRIFDDENGVMNLSVMDSKGEILIVSQFTLHASTKKGNRPSYIKAARPEIAVPLYEQFIRQMEFETGIWPKTGEFGAMMKVQLVNDGPVTIIIDTKQKE